MQRQEGLERRNLVKFSGELGFRTALWLKLKTFMYHHLGRSNFYLNNIFINKLSSPDFFSDKARDQNLVISSNNFWET